MQSTNPDSSPGTQTPTQQLATMLLGRDVTEFINEKREHGRAWRFIARDLYDATDGQIDVTYETLRSWHFADPGEVA